MTEQDAVACSESSRMNSSRTHRIPNLLWKEVWLRYWFDIALLFAIVLAKLAPDIARNGGILRGEVTIGYGAVFIIFLGSGLSMQTKELIKNILHWRAHVTVFILQFVITSAIIYIFANIIYRMQNPIISKWMLVGLIVTGCCPTTVSSNVVMTRNADGNVLLTLCEVFIGNLSGAVITPLLVQLLFRGDWAWANPANGSSVYSVFRNVMKQNLITVVLPLTIGQAIQNTNPEETKWFVRKFRMNIVGSVMLLMIMFSSFSTAFYQGSFEVATKKSILFLCVFNCFIYILFTVVCFIMARPIFIKCLFQKVPDDSTPKSYNFFYKVLRPFYYNRADTVSIMLCGGAKTAALGVSLITSQYGVNNPHLGELLVPLVLYQALQVITAGLLTPLMKHWVHSDTDFYLPREQLLDEEHTSDIYNSFSDNNNNTYNYS